MITELLVPRRELEVQSFKTTNYGLLFKKIGYGLEVQRFFSLPFYYLKKKKKEYVMNKYRFPLSLCEDKKYGYWYSYFFFPLQEDI